MAARLSQEQLADLARISVSAIGTLERGSRNAPQRQTLLLLASALELGPEARAELEFAASRGRIRKRGPIPQSPMPIGTQLPLYLTSFVGRETELAEATALVKKHRLVTILGAGGTGKTRLACAIATSAGHEPCDIRFLDLARVTSSGYLALGIASALGAPAREENDAIRKIAIQFSRRSMLLVLDNCEHVVDGVAPLVTALLRLCPALHILTTSRERLRVNGERVCHLEPLPAEPALQLFIDRAQALDPRFAASASLVSVATDVCRRLDGIPLAIELAVARLPSLGLIELQRRLDQQLALPGAHRDTPGRHQTMLATIAWSYDLLDEGERSLLLRLSVFVGGFTLNAAEIVCAGEDIPADEICTVLARLVDKSMIQISPDETPRYRLLEPVRLFSLQQLAAEGQYEEAMRRHVAWLVKIADGAHAELQAGVSENAIVQAVTPDFDNVRAALSRLTSARNQADSAVASRIAGGLRSLWITSGQFAEARRWCADIEAHLDAERELDLYGRLLRLKVQSARGGLDPAVAADAIRFFRRIDDRPGLANSYLHLLFVLCRRDEIDRIVPVLEEARDFFERHPALPPDIQSRFLAYRGHVEALRGNFDRARENIAAAFLLVPNNKLRWYANNLFKSSEIEALAGNYDEAIALGAEALNHEATALESTNLGARTAIAVYHLLAGDVRAAAAFLRETAHLMMHEHYDDESRLVGEVVALAAVISAGRGFPDEAARLKGYADTGDARLSIGAPGKRLMAQLDADLAGKLDPSRCDALRRWGSQLASEEAFDRALAALDDVLEKPRKMEVPVTVSGDRA